MIVPAVVSYSSREEVLIGVLLAAALGITALISFCLPKQKRHDDEYPSYRDIPNQILTHMPTKEELIALDHWADVIVVGSGIGGLTTANILSRMGYKVLVFEQHYTIGGSTHVYKTHGYDFDVGVHYVGGQLDQLNSPFRRLFDWLSDGKLEWVTVDPVYDVAYNATTKQRLEFVGDPQVNRKTLLKEFPDLDPQALDMYYSKCKTARLVAYLAFASKILPPFFTRLLWNKRIGIFGWLYKRYCLGTTLSVMQSCGLPAEVIGALTYSYGDYGTIPSKSPFFIQAFMEAHYDGGAFFPKGGSSSIAKTLVAAIERHGGKVYAGASVEKIMTAPSATTTWSLFGGRGYRATGVIVKGVEIRTRKCVVSDAGFARTFEMPSRSRIESRHDMPLVDPDAGARQLALVHRTAKSATRPFTPSTSFFYLFVGLEGTKEDLGLRGQNIWHLTSWDHDTPAKTLHNMTDAERAMEQPPPLIFLSVESAKDPDYELRCTGKSTVTLIAWADAKWFDSLRDTTSGNRGERYDAIKDRMQECLLRTLYFHFPLTRGRVAFTDLGTPLTVNKFLGRVSGEIYNLDHTEERFKTMNAQLALHPETTVRDLYLCGQDVMAVSVCGATLGGCFAASRVSSFALLAALPIVYAVFLYSC